MPQVSLRDRLRYRFDLTLSRGAPALIAWLLAITLLMVLLGALFVVITGLHPDDAGFFATLWSTLMHALDAGTVAGDAGSVAYLGVMFLVTLGGIFVVSILIGLITSGIESKLDDLRKGRSFVCETDHTVILGFTPQIFSVISELVVANKSRGQAAVAVLADRDKVEMEDDIRARLPDLGSTRVVCRSGSPIDPVELAIVNPNEARSIIVLAPEGDNPDAHIIKTLLALTQGKSRKEGAYHIVAEIRDPRNLDAARIAGGQEAQLLPTELLLSQIAVQTCRQTGLSVVFTELLDFDGDEIYMKLEPSLSAKTFRDALFAYETSMVLGVRHTDGSVALLPALDLVIQPGDAIIAISEDDTTVQVSGMARPPIDEEAIIVMHEPERPKPEKILLLGWNRRAPRILRGFDAYVELGSSVMVVADVNASSAIADACRFLRHLDVRFERADTTDRAVLDRLTEQHYDHVITLSYSDELDPQEADARTLITLIHLRDIESKRGELFSVVSEMLDLRNRQLAEVAKADDFIVSDKLVSLMLAQVSENKDLARVFEDLFDPEGSEIYLKPASNYVATSTPVSFYTVLESAARRGEVAIGYRTAVPTAKAPFGVRVNPPKSERISFNEDDRIIVLAAGASGLLPLISAA
ncbi:MAG TPA: potassium transporter TrkA [Polyangiaceae bacterium]|nr:potassium transporter TrkA [Polyangiaceae bacterium]